MKKLVSGIQTSGSLHLGNYLGSIKNWTSMQNDYECFLFLADLHSITVPQDPKLLRNSTLEVAAAYIASGVDPNKSAIFHQSSVQAHCELSWILSCITSMGWMNRMTQFKDKAGENKEKASLGLYSYPVLMAADILIYKANIVPVGDDQKQHLELTRNIAEAFNRHVNHEFFELPEPYILGSATRVMSLKDGTSKMSKSDPSDASRINLLDDRDTIAKKIKKAKSDSEPNIFFDKQNRPEISNLLSIFSALDEKPISEIVDNYQNKGCAQFKSDLADLIIDKIDPISTKMKELLNNSDYLIEILNKGSYKANLVANGTIKQVKELIGFIS